MRDSAAVDRALLTIAARAAALRWNFASTHSAGRIVRTAFAGPTSLTVTSRTGTSRTSAFATCAAGAARFTFATRTGDRGFCCSCVRSRTQRQSARGADEQHGRNDSNSLKHLSFLSMIKWLKIKHTIAM